MPITYRVDHDAHVVIAVGHGVVTDADVFGYQLEVGAAKELVGYDELIDMTRVTEIATPSSTRVRELAELGARMDPRDTKTRFAIVAPTDVAFGLGRMFQTYRELDRRSNKEVGVFRTMEEALAFLGVSRPLTPPELP